MPGSDLPSNDEELDAAMALAALVGGEFITRGGAIADERDPPSWSLRRRRSGSVIVVNEQGSPLSELSTKLAKMQEWEEKQRRGVGAEERISQELSQSDGGSSGSGGGGRGPVELGISSLIPGVDQAAVEKAFEQGLVGIAQLLQEDRPSLIRAPSFPPQLSVNTLLPQLSGGGLQSQLSLGLESQRSNAGELQSQLSAPSAFLAAIAASLPLSASPPWPSYPTLANPLSNPVSNPIARVESGSGFQPLKSPSPKLVDFLSLVSEKDEGLKKEPEDCDEGLEPETGKRDQRALKAIRRKAAVRIACLETLKGIAAVNPEPAVSEDPDPVKEAQRLRRIQANRESARKTIVKKQEVCKKLSTEARKLGDENLDLRSGTLYGDTCIMNEIDFSFCHALEEERTLFQKVEAAQRELQRLVTEQEKLKQELLLAQTGADEPLDPHPSASAPLLPDLSDDRKSNDGLIKPSPGLVNQFPRPAPSVENQSPKVSKGETLLEGLAREELPKPVAIIAEPGVGRVDSGEGVGVSGGAQIGLGNQVLEPSLGGKTTLQTVRSGEGSNEEFKLQDPSRDPGNAEGIEERKVLGSETLTKRGSNESVSANRPSEKEDGLGGSFEQPTSHSQACDLLEEGGANESMTFELRDLLESQDPAALGEGAAELYPTPPSEAPGRELRDPPRQNTCTFLGGGLQVEERLLFLPEKPDGKVLPLNRGSTVAPQKEAGKALNRSVQLSLELLHNIAVGKGGAGGNGENILVQSRSLPTNPWLSLEPQPLNRHRSAPSELPRGPPNSRLDFVPLSLEGLPANPVETNNPSLVSNPNSGYDSSQSLEAMFKLSSQTRSDPNAWLKPDPGNPGLSGNHGLSGVPELTMKTTLDGGGLSLGSGSWWQEGGTEWGSDPLYRGGSLLSNKEAVVPGNTGPALGIPAQSWASNWAGGTGPGEQWIGGHVSEKTPHVDISLKLEPPAPSRTVKPETGLYNMYRGCGRRGSVSLHIGPLPVVDAVTAAEARKRRREVTKSKFGASGSASAKVQKLGGAKAK